MKQHKILIAVSTVILPALLYSCTSAPATETANRFALTDTMIQKIKIDTVTVQTVRTELRFSGKITPEDNKMANVYPVVSGYVTKLNVSLGDYVTKGQVMATIRSTDIAEFEKQRRDGENDLLVAKKNLKTAQELFDSRLNTERDITIAKKEVELAEAELKRLNEVFSIYHVREGANYNIVAPISGFVIEKKMNADMQLPAGFTESIFTIAQIDEVFVTANVYETDISKLTLGMPASTELISYPGQRYEGKIDRILNVLDPETKTLKIRIRLKNPGYAFKPEMAATVYISREEIEQKPAVPAEAIVFDKNKNFVMVYHTRDSIETRTVETLRTTGNTTFLRAGLRAGEQVISKNALLIYDAIND